MHAFIFSTLLALSSYHDVSFAYGKKQTATNECGLASAITLRGIYAKSDIEVPIETVYLGRTSMLVLKTYLNAQGIDCAGYRIAYDSLILETITKPVLLHFATGTGHFALCYYADESGVVLFDPSRGNIYLNSASLMFSWDKTALIFKDAPPADSWTKVQDVTKQVLARQALLNSVVRSSP